MDGAEVVERIRSWSSVPIIVLSVRGAEAQKVHLLELGADDYVVKPFGMAELLARVRVALRRQMRAASGEPKVVAGPLTIDLAVRAVYLNDARLALTPKEYRLLQVLAQHAGNVVTHQHLLKEVWGTVHVHDTHYLRIFVRKLRQKIEPKPDSPRILVTELGRRLPPRPVRRRGRNRPLVRSRGSRQGGNLKGWRGRPFVNICGFRAGPHSLTGRGFPRHKLARTRALGSACFLTGHLSPSKHTTNRLKEAGPDLSEHRKRTRREE